LKYLQTKFYPNFDICRKNLYQTICQGKLLDRELFQQIAKETSTKKYLRNMPTKNVLKTNLYEKTSEEKSHPRNFFQKFCPKKIPR